MNKLLIIFVKNPELGRVKTRLARSLGDDVALAIYLRLLTHTQEVIEDLAFDKAVYYSKFVDSEDNWENKRYEKYLQKGADLGDKMFHAISESLAKGYESVCLIGTDIYELTADVIKDGFIKLETHDVVIGPAKDGGYYLIGMKKAYPEIFDLHQWGISNVFSETVKRIENKGLTYAQTKLLNDIDEPEDLKGTDLAV
ncbi:Glycosyltransferase [Fulvivirga imtechensis AK7]|uniref:Glycosyltransferase n=1 Tax=Fulvivirga imtechensis AK7 TaxID=1237149 RepID=L8JLU6_9BACT|nr:TIGR04282 family arsenosugar biosynthesis glycosyltransferase [Fulvivirga imtechensis]ELR69760.1 Glycosyltransferase [Fulvivirga imtechensis AK7]